MIGIEDRIAIQDLYARYCHCMDEGDIKGWANSWTDNGVLDSAAYLDSRAKIEEHGWELMKDRPKSERINSQHWTNNLLLEGDGKSATGKCYLLVVGKARTTGELKVFIQGWYHDDLVKLPTGEWKFTRRKLIRNL